MPDDLFWMVPKFGKIKFGSSAITVYSAFKMQPYSSAKNVW